MKGKWWDEEQEKIKTTGRRWKDVKRKLKAQEQNENTWRRVKNGIDPVENHSMMEEGKLEPSLWWSREGQKMKIVRQSDGRTENQHVGNLKKTKYK